MEDTGRQSFRQGLGTFARGVAESLRSRLSPSVVVGEIAATITDKSIPQGAAELAQAIHGESNAYVPYGPAQGPAPVDAEYGVHGKPLESTPPDSGPTSASLAEPFASSSVPDRHPLADDASLYLHGSPAREDQATRTTPTTPRSPTKTRSREIGI